MTLSWDIDHILIISSKPKRRPLNGKRLFELKQRKSLVMTTQCCAYWTESKHKENTKQADLRGSPKPGTSTEAADCILLEE